jgi:adenine-specific DNA-methyltransferase
VPQLTVRPTGAALRDRLFGAENFVAQIYFRTTTGRLDEHLDRAGNYLLWFARDADALRTRPAFQAKLATDDAAHFSSGDLQSQGVRVSASYEVLVDGKRFVPQAGNHWKVTEQEMHRLIQSERVHVATSVIRFKRFSNDFPLVPIADVWTDTGGGAGTDKMYVVQTNSKIIQRCLLMATDPGDLVLDPTCGSGTSAFVAEQC